MAVALLVMVVLLLLQGCSCGPYTADCMDWSVRGNEICCNACHPGHRLMKKCGQSLEGLCTPCEPGTFTLSPNVYRCELCTICAGAQVLKKHCTRTADTQCGCREGLECGDDQCSFCVDRCPKGQEPTDHGSCRPCPNGTFNDKSHQKCKPWSTKCSKENQRIDAVGDAFTDIRCVDVSEPKPVVTPGTKDVPDTTWPLVLPVVAGIVLMIFIVVILTAVSKSKKKPSKPIIRPPTDDPQTLIAIECSFHEAEQEQGSSSESLDSKDSSEQLIR